MKPSNAEAGWSSVLHCFDNAHPTAAGHFPGNPIIPGALLLDHALRAIGTDVGTEVQVVKFLRPVRPGDAVSIRWRRDGALMQVECWVGDERALSGVVRAP